MLLDKAVDVDASALIKWYVSKPYSNGVKAFLTGEVHYRLLAEREFATPLADGSFGNADINRRPFGLARELIRQVEPVPLRTINVLHRHLP